MTIKEVTHFVTEDGESFETYQLALSHRAWLVLKNELDRHYSGYETNTFLEMLAAHKDYVEDYIHESVKARY